MYNLNRKLEELEVQGKSIKIAIIGAGHIDKQRMPVLL